MDYVKVDMWQQYREAYSESWENNLVALHSNFSLTEPEIWVRCNSPARILLANRGQ